MAFSAFDPLTFLTILLLTFALFLLITGAFTGVSLYFRACLSQAMPVEVLIVLGSKTDSEVGKKAGSLLDEFGVEHEMVVASAHRTPDLLRDLIRNTPAKVFIAVAGLSAALPGTIAAHTTKPVIGVPVSGKLNLDAILSVSQMPPGVPVAAVGLDRGENAAILAVEMLALHDERLAEKLKDHRDAMKKWVLEDSRTLGE